TIFGKDLETTALKIKDSAGREELAQLLFISAGQVNFVLPTELSNGNGVVTLLRTDGTAPSGTLRLAPVAPGLFTADANGKGLAVGVSIRVAPDNSQVIQPLSEQIDFGSPGNRVFVALFGTGFRHFSTLSAINVVVDGVASEVVFAGPQGGFNGL